MIYRPQIGDKICLTIEKEVELKKQGLLGSRSGIMLTFQMSRVTIDSGEMAIETAIATLFYEVIEI